MDAGGQPAEFVVRGVDIRIWQENGVVFAEASSWCAASTSASGRRTVSCLRRRRRQGSN
jgi:hypothetical protein